MSFIESILYGFISGVTEFLPVSSRAHQALFRYLFGVKSRIPLQEFLVHIGVLFAIIVGLRELLARFLREQKASSSSRRRKRYSLESRTLYDLRLIKTASVPLLVGLSLYFATAKTEYNLLLLMSFILLNASVLLLADHTRRGNRDSRTMSGLDGIMMGIAGAASSLPGVSRTGMISAYGTARGADSQNVINWAVLLGIPAMLFAVLYDLTGMIGYGMGVTSFWSTIYCVLSGVAAFGGGYIGISLLKIVVSHSGFSKFAYYGFGMAIFTFVLYLIT